MKNTFVLCALFCVGLVVAQRRPPQPVETNTFGYWSGNGIKASIAQLKPGERPAFSRLNRGNHSFSLSFRSSSGRLRNRFSVIGLGTRFLRGTPIGQVQILPAG